MSMWSRLPRGAAAIALLGVMAGSGVAIGSFLLLPATSAFADTQPYELYCPGTPVGTIALNDVVTSGTISPATLTSGTQFHLENFQTKVSLPKSIAAASQALGNTAITGTASATVDVTGATPASVSSGTISFNAPIPTPIPDSGIPLLLPATASTLGPFTATGGAISVNFDSKASLSVAAVPGSAPLNLSCTAYPNNTIPTSGITSATPTGSPVSPSIATATAAAGSATTATTAAPATTATTAAPATASSSATTAAATPSSTAYTGAGPQLWLLALVGFALLVVGFTSFLAGADGRGPLRKVLRLAGSYRSMNREEFARSLRSTVKSARRPAARSSDRVPIWQSPFVSQSTTGLWVEGDLPSFSGPGRSRNSDSLWIDGAHQSAEPEGGSGRGLWIEGWEPDS